MGKKKEKVIEDVVEDVKPSKPVEETETKSGIAEKVVSLEELKELEKKGLIVGFNQKTRIAKFKVT